MGGDLELTGDLAGGPGLHHPLDKGVAFPGWEFWQLALRALQAQPGERDPLDVGPLVSQVLGVLLQGDGGMAPRPADLVIGSLEGAPNQQRAQVASIDGSPSLCSSMTTLWTTSPAETPAYARPSSAQAAAWYMASRWAR